ncbi:MAG: domain S-box protein, partial [Sediminibacterium sp.]|nr:domain S-box protein [Sediminibacterium sp.]
VGFDTDQKKRGIGLENIRMRASLHKGELQIVSSPGKGCELIVGLSIEGNA